MCSLILYVIALIILGQVCVPFMPFVYNVVNEVSVVYMSCDLSIWPHVVIYVQVVFFIRVSYL